MQEIKITILRKEDLDLTKKDIDVNNALEIINSVVKGTNNRVWLSHSTFVIFFDDRGNSTIIKNRYSENSEETKTLLQFARLLYKRK